MAALRSPGKLARLFFWPVYFFTEKVRFARSLLLLVLLIPDGYVAYMLVRATTDSVEFSAKESDGVTWIAPARALLATVQRMRVIDHPGTEGGPEVSALMVTAEQQLAAVDAVDAKLGGPNHLDTAAGWAKTKDLWAVIKKGGFADAAARDKAFTDFTGQLANEMIVNEAGNNSNLILDPDLDSYWMMDAYVFKLPTLGEVVANAAIQSQGLVSGGTISNDDRADLASTLGQINSTSSDLINVDLHTALADNEKYNEGREGNKRLRPLEPKFNELTAALHAFTDLLKDKIVHPATPSISTKEIATRAAALIDQIQELQVLTAPELDRLCVERANRYRDQRLIGILVFIGAALLISYVFNGFTSSVRASQAILEEEHERQSEDIRNLLDVVSRAADGDLKARAKVGDGVLGNVSDAFNQMMESWQELIGAITHQLDRTSQAVDELVKSSAAMASGASNQAESVSAASGQIQRMSIEIGRVSGNAAHAATAAERTKESAQQGSESVTEVVQGMESLRSLVQAGAKKVKTLGDRSMEITSIVGTIAMISEQTNMLAINASIEAARAGEQGRGFSVVADEVRKLAERTAAATQEIDKLVKAIQVETAESVTAIERQTQVVEEEGKAVANAGNVLGRIREVSLQSSSLAADISTTARAHVDDARNVVGTMERISAIAKETEGQAQGSLKIVRGLGELSDELRVSVGKFKV